MMPIAFLLHCVDCSLKVSKGKPGLRAWLVAASFHPDPKEARLFKADSEEVLQLSSYNNKKLIVAC